MKIISWNCCGKFREKYENIKQFNADLYIIQECEDPKRTTNIGYQNFAKDSIWIGPNKNKGLGVFASNNTKIIKNNWKSCDANHFLPVRVNDAFDVLAVWAGRPYIEAYFSYHMLNEKFFSKDTVVIGDFNSNKSWDAKHSPNNHSAVLSLFEKTKLTSAYHFLNQENQGEESKNTFYLYRHADKGYHIDYAFLHEDRIIDFDILDSKDWLCYSDHVPVILTIYVENE